MSIYTYYTRYSVPIYTTLCTSNRCRTSASIALSCGTLLSLNFIPLICSFPDHQPDTISGIGRRDCFFISDLSTTHIGILNFNEISFKGAQIKYLNVLNHTTMSQLQFPGQVFIYGCFPILAHLTILTPFAFLSDSSSSIQFMTLSR